MNITYNIDCMEYMRGLPDKAFDLAVVDPPYGGVAQYEGPVTMGSLFDGIGGFPLAFQRAGAKAVWASEIEEFPIAVTKKRFGED